jgi:hypothetical protein
MFENPGTRVYDVQCDPKQEKDYRDPVVVARLREGIVAALREHDCPVEVYDRLGLLDAAGGTR